jgi:signal transduction histidine kinase
MLATVAVASAVTFGWAGWEMLRQESAVEEQRERERLENRADRVVQTIERVLSEVDQQLDARIAVPRGGLPATSEGLLLVFDQRSIQPVSPSVLVFYPVLSALPEPPDSLFAAAEADEFQRHALAQSADAYRRLARSPDRAVRAASLVRLARVLRQLNRGDAALEVYQEMAGLEDAQVVGAPAPLVARDAEMRLLERLGRHEEAEVLARGLQRDLATGRWAVTTGQYEHYAAEAARISGREIPRDERLAAAHAAAEFWTAWRAAPSPRGRMLVGPADVRHLVAWRSGGTVSAAWVIPLDQLVARMPVEVRQGISFIEGNGASSGGRDRAKMSVARTSTDTGLPFSVQATGDNARAQYGFMSRGRLVVAALSVMLAFLLATAYFVGRAVRREVSLARLQADFVSAVSHEFRTPLASMRQLSELLAAGRVPFEARRQEYYDSLAAESRRLQRLVENLLEFGKLEAGPRPYRIEPVDSRALMESAVTDFRSQLGRSDCRIEVSWGSVEARVLADREAMTLVLHNLLDNAVKYSGGRSVRLCCEPEGDRVAFSVSDEGPGISAEDRHRIFQKFVRGASAAATNVKGTGLGLAVAKLIVTGHGGEIRVNSRPDAGSTFTVVLPAQG